MWKPQKFKLIYLMATLYVLTLTLPSASAVYWAFGDDLLTHSNAFALLPRNGFRDTAVILMLIHQVTLYITKYIEPHFESDSLRIEIVSFCNVTLRRVDC